MARDRRPAPGNDILLPRRLLVAELVAGAGLVALAGCHCASPPDKLSITSVPTMTSSPQPPPLPPTVTATLTGTVLTLRYRYSRTLAARFPGSPWAATLLVAIHPPSAGPTVQTLAQGTLRTEGPLPAGPDGEELQASADVDLAAFFGLTAPYVRHVHASFLHLVTDVVRVASG